MNEVYNVSNGMVVTKTYQPAGIDHNLQSAITGLMHSIAVMNSEVTLAEMGYLNMNMVSFVEDHVEVKLYFIPNLATVTERAPNGKPISHPNPKLNIFKDYMFVGDLEKAISFDTITVPKYNIDIDELGKPAIKIKSGKKTEEDQEVLVLHCNLAVVLAAINNVDMMDPNFNVSFETVTATKKLSLIHISEPTRPY